MSTIAKTDAVVLRSMKYRDTSRIVTFYTKAFGKIRGIAKGARSARNKFGSALDPLSRVHLVLYHKEQQDLHLISQCDLRASSRFVRDDLGRVSSGLACLEMLDQVTHDREHQPALFRLIDEALGELERGGGDPEILLFAFKVRLAEQLGFLPSLEKCLGCERTVASQKESAWWFDVSRGSAACGECEATRSGRMSAIRASADCLSVLSRLQSLPLTECTSLTASTETWNETRELLRLYLKYHVEHLKPLRSEVLLTAAKLEQ